MKTDISLDSPTCKIIIDAKYYREAMVKRYDREKFRSAHSYQMFAYMSNASAAKDTGKDIEGILLYPTVEKSFTQTFRVHDYLLSFRTLNLQDTWEEIEGALLGMVKTGN